MLRMILLVGGGALTLIGLLIGDYMLAIIGAVAVVGTLLIGNE